MSTVLVVEDDQNIRIVLGRLLPRLGYESILCASAEEAVDVVAERRVDAILLDLRLPGMDGFSFLRQVQRDHRRVPVVVMTGAGTMEDAITAIRLRASDFLQKPFQDDELKDALEAAIRERAWQSSGEIPAYRPPPEEARDGAPPGNVAQDGAGDAAPGRSEDAQRTVQSAIAAMKEVEWRIRQGRIQLPVLDDRVGRVQKLMGRTDCGVGEVLDLIGRDPALAATCLRAANSSAYGAGKTIASLRQACVQLGNRRVMAFAAEALTRDSFVARREPFRSILNHLWRNSLVTARIIERLARIAHRASPAARAALPSPDELYVAGLLHNVGELLLLQLLSQVEEFEVRTEMDRAVLGEVVHARHESFGGRLALKWALPRLVARLAGAHHRPMPGKESRSDTYLRHIVLASWAIALRGGHTYLPAPAPPDPVEYLEKIEVVPAAVEPLYEEMERWSEDLDPSGEATAAPPGGAPGGAPASDPEAAQAPATEPPETGPTEG